MRTRSLVLSLLASALAWPAAAAPALTPVPVEVVEAQGAFGVRDGTRVVVPKGDKAAADAARLLADLTTKAGGPRLTISEGGSAAGAIVLRRGPTKLPGDEAYGLKATPDGVTLTAAHDAGFARGAASLWQLITADAAHAIPAL